MARHFEDQMPDRQGAPGLVPRYFLDESARVDEDTITITGGKANRLKRVMRVRRDDPLELVHPLTDRLYRATIERVSRDDVICQHRRESVPASAAAAAYCHLGIADPAAAL